MTRDDAEKLLPIIKAYSENKEIEYFNGLKWEDREEFRFSADPSQYRIKSKYRPFKSVEECWEEMQKHQPFGYVKHKNNNHYFSINFVGNNSDFNYHFKNYLFADGTPYGIKEEE